MRWLVLSVSMFFFHPAAAAVFRVADLGASCDSISDRELAVGSKQVPWKPSFLAFRTELLGEQVTAVYLCRDGLLFTENYYFPARETEESLKDFRKAYDAFRSRYGAAILDNTPWQANPDSRWVEKDATRYYVTWKNPEVRITIVLMQREGDAGSRRQLFVIVGAGDPA